ncbi:MarR family winged helix-turn-helix transcriptional regulator [Sphaerochaeta globosa]|uniref:Regulatory protein MarR n=1 Tax=Sphaerochaeta globosa (strain ATCC BAA-1886 / DSM 22777 / Buddy) TaxID=158189 RepID=F0RUE9_SPHGB|nr:MarR family transcriptional regulator [Sphaerochaeta globosa]ADY12311.1 regulatory protein MarR [Sphaerochaeta globosa str. Buddy]
MQHSLSRLVAILHRNHAMYVNRVLKPWNITSGEVGFLMTLYQEEGRTQEQLSSILSIDKAAATRALTSLQDKGYIQRRVNEQDKRCKCIYLTQKAKELRQVITTQVRTWNSKAANLIGESTYDQLCLSLETILSNEKAE